ncbi:hypothetical protein [Bacillus sp. FJAT-47783]|uniref:hypothetical protein n=1 Tax=Bacillus sp. FJAT-47783 TaxID=2922712 RepID=UPI001FAC3058|nr:hypothetical protein [Bacillus sp. FJAT-47783]
MLDLNVTSGMEKSMHQFHGMGYEEYSRKHKNRMLVERTREKDHFQCQQIISIIERRLY